MINSILGIAHIMHVFAFAMHTVESSFITLYYQQLKQWCYWGYISST